MEYLHIMRCKCIQLKLKAILQSSFQLPDIFDETFCGSFWQQAEKNGSVVLPDRAKSLLEVLAV